LEMQGIPIHVVIIDHLPHIRPIEKAWNENDERAKAAADVKQLAKDLNVALVIPTQAATEVEEKQMKGKRAGRLDVYGSKGQIHVANVFLIITFKGIDEKQTGVEEWEKDVFWLVDCKKNRDGPPFWFSAKHLVREGRVIEVFDKGDSAGNAVDEETNEDVIKEADEKITSFPSGDGQGQTVKETSVNEQNIVSDTQAFLEVVADAAKEVKTADETVKPKSVLERLREKKLGSLKNSEVSEV